MLAAPQLPEGSALLRMMVLPGRGVPVALSFKEPEMVKDSLTAGVASEVVMVRVVGVRASTAGAALQNNNAQTTTTTAATITTLSFAHISPHIES